MMRRILGAVAVLVAVVGLMACEPTPPKPTVTITAKPDSTKPYCGGGSWIRGKVTPAAATPQVVLQRTKNGKWEDWVWRISYDSRPPGKIVAKVDSAGAYKLPYAIPLSTSTLHLRVRSNGGGVTSPGFYVSPRTDDPEIPCG